jgi:hypothetical protein
MVYLLAFWPGLMTSDSQDQWNQLLTGLFHNAHPAFHTLTYWLITRVWLSPAAVAIAQIIALSTIFGFTLHELEYWGVPLGVRLIITMLFAFSPVNGLMVITLWKDIAYTIVLLSVFAILLRLVRTHGTWLHSTSHLAVLCVSLLCTALYRHNGLPLVILIILALAIWLKSRTDRLRVIAVGASASAVFIMIVGPVYTLLNVKPMTSLFSYQELVHQVGAVVHEKGIMEKSDQELLTAIQPVASWKNAYNCYSLNPLIYNDTIDSGYFETHAAAFRELWLRYMLQNPGTLLRHQGCVTSMIWRVTQSSGGYLDTAPYGTIEKNSSGIVSDSQWPLAQNFLTRLVDRSRQVNYSWWTWRPALYLYLTLYVVVVTAIRLKQKSILMLALPSLLNSLVLLALITVQDFRFQYPIYVIGLVAPALLFIHTRLEHQSNSAITI